MWTEETYVHMNTYIYTCKYLYVFIYTKDTEKTMHLCLLIEEESEELDFKIYVGRLWSIVLINV